MTYSSSERAILYPNDAFEGLISGSTIATGESDNYALHTAGNDDEYAAIEQTRAGFTSRLGFGSLVTMKQVHGDRIHLITADNLKRYTGNPLIDGDGLITMCKGILIGILTADCVPVFFAAPQGIIGIAHAGWKGVFAGIHNKMLDVLHSGYSIEPSLIKVWFGPNIRPCCYEVGKELVDQFITNGKNPVYNRRDEKYYFDLEGTISSDLISNGVLPANITSPGLCTFESSNPRFFSYRRGDEFARTLSFIGIFDKQNKS